jgi:hypothetical protein
MRVSKSVPPCGDAYSVRRGPDDLERNSGAIKAASCAGVCQPFFLNDHFKEIAMGSWTGDI